MTSQRELASLTTVPKFRLAKFQTKVDFICQNVTHSDIDRTRARRGLSESVSTFARQPEHEQLLPQVGDLAAHGRHNLQGMYVAQDPGNSCCRLGEK